VLFFWGKFSQPGKKKKKGLKKVERVFFKKEKRAQVITL
jgi:hypothetical protein